MSKAIQVWDGTQFVPANVPVGAVPNAVAVYNSASPTNAQVGTAWFDTNTNKLKVYSGSAWIEVSVDLSGYATLSSPTFTGQIAVPSGTASAPSISPSGDTNTGLFFPAADTLAFSSNGTERMRIDSSGRTTRPFQPSFYAYGSGLLSISGASQLRIIELANTYNNVGSHFNTSTFKFTTPIAGTYLFFGRATTSTATSTGPALFINVNNGSFALEVAINYSNINFTSFSGMMIRTLQANDTVELSINNYNNTSFTLDRGRCSLSGFLIG